MKFTVDEIVAATGGEVETRELAVASRDALEFVADGASIDTRSLLPGQLFVPIEAERDGHDFIPAAVEAGARIVLARRSVDISGAVKSTVIRVADTTQALTALGAAAATRLGAENVPIVGITGSVGKTSVKDLATAALASLLPHASERSFNNELGVPLTLLNVPEATGAVVVEMGARGRGHIRHLCEIAKPTVGVVTMVGAVHTSEFGSVEEVAATKAELVEAIAASGTVLLNADEPLVAAMADRTDANVVTWSGNGDNTDAHFHASSVVFDDQVRPSFTGHTPAGPVPVSLMTPGVHQVGNALAALAIAHVLGVEPLVAADGLASASLSPHRMDVQTAPDGSTIVNDAYNANALSMAAALRSLVRLAQPRRFAVLGTMAELGDRHDLDHRAMTDLANELGVEAISFNEAAYGLPTVTSIEAAVSELAERGMTGPDCAVLVKGSRVAGLERLAEALLTAT